MVELIRKRRGAAAVMITMLFVSISAVLLIIFGVSLRYSAANTADAVLYNSCRTLLSFYDKELQERYGIFGLEASESEMEKLVEQYMKSSMSAASYKRSELESIGIESAAFSLADADNLSAQLTGIMKYMILDTGFDEFSSFLTDTLTGMSDRENLEEMIENEKESMAAAEEAQKERDDEEDSSEKIDFASIRRVHKQLEESKKAAEEQEPELSEEDTVLRNCRVKDSLPSAVNDISRKGAFDGSGTFKYFTSGKKGLESAYENFMIDEYVLHYFSDYMDSEHEGFFSNEAEYVLYGDHTCIVKYFDGQFAQGADGLKILKAKDCDAKYLFYALTTFNINSNEYKRHWSDVKNIDIPVPSSETQQQIVAQLDKFESLIANLKRELELRKKQYEYYREKLLTFE